MSEKRGWSRRRFLSARGLGASAGGLLGAVLSGNAAERIVDDRTVCQWCISRRAMACEFTVYLPPIVHDPMVAGQAALEEIGRIEELLSIYRETSALSRVNRCAVDGPVRVDEELYRLLQRCDRLTKETEGAFDVAAGALIGAWGFLEGPGHVPDEAELRDARARTGMHHVELDDDELMVRHRVAGLGINLGSIGKGYALDRAMAVLRDEFRLRDALMQGGLSSLCGMGSASEPSEGWWIGIQNPFDPARRLAAVRLRDRALGTSGSACQYFEAGGRRYGHVLDPRTGRPADGLASASVIAPCAADADALATALFVMGLDKAADFCQDHADVGALLVLQPEPGRRTGEPPRVVTFNLPPEDVNLNPGDDPPADPSENRQT